MADYKDAIQTEGTDDDAITGGEEGMSISSDLIRGHINTIILRSLYDGDKYGYDILNEIESKTGGLYAIKQPTLYSALKRLESLHYVASYYGEFSNGGRRKYFRLTDEGREFVNKSLSEWEYSRTIIDSLIADGDKHFDFSFITEKQKELDAIKKNLTAREAALAEEKNSLKNLQSELECQRSLLSVQSTALSSQKSDYNDLKDKIASQERELAEKERLLNEKQRELATSEAQLERLREETEENNRDMDRLQEQIRTLENASSSDSDEIAALSASLEEKNAALNEKTEELGAKTRELNEKLA